VCVLCVCVRVCARICMHVRMYTTVHMVTRILSIKMSLKKTVAIWGPLPTSTRKTYTHSTSRREEMLSDKLTVSWKKLCLFVGNATVTHTL